MRVRRTMNPAGRPCWELLDDHGQPIAAVSAFLRYLQGRDCSPHTLSAYVYDLRHFYGFLAARQMADMDMEPAHAVDLLAYLRQVPCRRPVQRLGLVRCTTQHHQPATCLSPESINRVLATVSSYYEYLIISGYLHAENPIQQRPDPAYARVANRRRPAMGSSSRQRPVRRFVRAKTVVRVPRPIADEQVQQLLQACRRLRDRAILLLMLHGGLRPGEVLNLRFGDIQFGRRQITIRHYTDHPRGVRTKSRTERQIAIFEADGVALRTLNAYMMQERPADTDSPFIFLVGGRGQRRHEPLSYAALVKNFQRQCERLGIRTPWLTPHACRHTHATSMWEGGMRELTLQRRLGHASPYSTQTYTRVSDAVVIAEYTRALGGE